MAIFLFIFAGLCGLITSFLSLMLLNFSWAGAGLVFFATCYSVAFLPVLLDMVMDARKS